MTALDATIILGGYFVAFGVGFYIVDRRTRYFGVITDKETGGVVAVALCNSEGRITRVIWEKEKKDA